MRYDRDMRTTVTLADDVVAAVERVRRERSIGLSEAINELARAGLVHQEQAPREPFVQKTSKMGAPRIPIDNIGEVLDWMDRLDEEPDAR